MEVNKERYMLLNTKDFENISKKTLYATSYVRQILRSHVAPETDRCKNIIEEAEKILAKKLKKLNPDA